MKKKWNMKPKIDKTSFGSITIAGEIYDYDVIIRLDGKVEKRQKKLSKQVYGTSHMISLAEAEHVYEKGADRLILGTGQSGMVTLSQEAEGFFRQNACKVELLPTLEAIQHWNQAEGKTIAMFHITC